MPFWNKVPKKLFYTILPVSIVLAGKFNGAYVTNILALFSDSWHLVTVLAALIISWGAYALQVNLHPINTLLVITGIVC